MKKVYVAYYRVSTREQGDSGLGLLAQKTAALNFISRSGGEINKSFQEIESGKNCDRKQLSSAIEYCQKNGYTLLIAKLDRLSRNARFILTLRESGVKFVCADMPEANNLTIGLLAILAEDEAKRTSDRTKSALNEIKLKIAKGEVHISKSGKVVVKLGNPSNLTNEDRKKGNEAKKAKISEDVERQKSKAYATALYANTISLAEVANQLNKAGFTAPKGGKFSKTQVARLLNN